MTEVLKNTHPAVFILGGISLLGFHSWYGRPNLDHIPTIGSTGLMSYVDGCRFLQDARSMFEKGYAKFRGNAFKIAYPSTWFIVLTTPELVDEMRLADVNDISFDLGIDEILQSKFTTGFEAAKHNAHHADVVRTSLTRNLTAKYEEIHDEVVQSFEDLIPLASYEKGWASVQTLPTVQKIVCRTTNRLLLGLPTCRDAEWIDLNIQFSVKVFIGAAIVKIFPSFLKPIVGYFVSPLNYAMRLARKHLRQEIEERISMENEHGRNYNGRPNDAISWLLNYAPEEERTADEVIIRLLIINMAAIHTSSNTFTQALFNLVAYPEYIEPLREEVRGVIQREGWTKAALNKMYKVDSFLRESIRMEGIGAISMTRRVVNPAGYTFANGLHAPYGALMGAPVHYIHHDAAFYDDPFTFDGFRFSKMRDQGEGDHGKHQLGSTSLSYLSFGHGKHACPGRFFAANELKTMLAHVLVTYDVALEGDSKPVNNWLGAVIQVNSKANVLFRRLDPEDSN